MKSIVKLVLNSAGSGGSCGAIVYFIERTYSHPLLIEDAVAFIVAAISMVCLAFSAEFN